MYISAQIIFALQLFYTFYGFGANNGIMPQSTLSLLYLQSIDDVILWLSLCI